MPAFDGALRGYGFATHTRDRWKCVYCGLDGRDSFAAWLCLSCDHLLPPRHPQRDDPRFIVTSCQFCNVADNLYFTHAIARGLTFEGKTPDALIAQRRPYVQETRDDFRHFWEQHVRAERPPESVTPKEP